MEINDYRRGYDHKIVEVTGGMQRTEAEIKAFALAHAGEDAESHFGVTINRFRDTLGEIAVVKIATG